MSDFQTMIEKERDRLTKQREDALARRTKIDEELESIDRELAAIAAYEAAKSGKTAKRKAGGRAARGTVKTSVLGIIQKMPQGIARGDIVATMGTSATKASEQSISNALSALKKAGRITSKDGKYLST
jgi:hypothetical protein